MVNYRLICIFSLFLLNPLYIQSETVTAESKIKIACIGDSLTFGLGLLHRQADSYPAQLSKKLSSEYIIKNFGISGASATKSSIDNYLTESPDEIIDWKPQILLIMLGSNDTKNSIWLSQKEFIIGFKEIIHTFGTSETEIILMTPPPCKLNPFGINDNLIRTEIIPALKKISSLEHYPLIDIYTALSEKENIYIDNIHLNRNGYSVISTLLADYLNSKKKTKLFISLNSRN